MKEAVYKFFTAVLMVLIFFGMLHAMNILADLNDYNSIKRMAKKNSGIASAGPEIPAVSAKAPAEAMRTEPAPITAEDLSYIYIDGIRFDFPCTLAQIYEHFETQPYSNSFDEKTSAYNRTETLLKNGVSTYMITCTADSKDAPPEKWIIRSIGRGTNHYSEKYSPQLVIAGMEIFRTSDEEYLHLSALDENEYLTSDRLIIPHKNDGYIVFNPDNKALYFYKNNDPDLQNNLERSYPVLIKNELRLPEDYDPEIVPENKEELREFALEYYAYDDDMYYSTRKYREEIERMVTENYDTAYEFLAVITYEFDTDAYFELTQIESIKYDKEADKTSDGGYLKVTATCYIEGYDEPIETEMILKIGDRLGDALLIHMET